MDTELQDKIRNEEALMSRLNNLNIKIGAWWVSILNSILKEKSKEYKEWASIETAIKETFLTEEGQTRLYVKHQLMKDRILPQSSVLLLTLVPIGGYWLAKTVITYFVSARIKEYQVQKSRMNRRLSQSKQKEDKRRSKGLIK